MIEIRKTDVYAMWLDGLLDVRARARILARVERLAAGNPGDVRAVACRSCGSIMVPAIGSITRSLGTS